MVFTTLKKTSQDLFYRQRYLVKLLEAILIRKAVFKWRFNERKLQVSLKVLNLMRSLRKESINEKVN